MLRITCCGVACLLLSAGVARAGEPASQDDKLLSGISIVGDDEAPKSLVIVPWKASALGDLLDVSKILDDGRQPVDKEVFMRQLDYYEIRTGARQTPRP